MVTRTLLSADCEQPSVSLPAYLPVSATLREPHRGVQGEGWAASASFLRLGRGSRGLELVLLLHSGPEHRDGTSDATLGVLVGETVRTVWHRLLASSCWASARSPVAAAWGGVQGLPLLLSQWSSPAPDMWVRSLGCCRLD